MPFALIIEHRKTIVGSTLLLLVLTLLVMPQASTESNFLDVFFKSSSKTAQGFRLADEQLSGSGSVDIILQSSETETFKKLDAFEYIKKEVKVLQQVPLVNSVESLLEPVAMVHQPLSDRQSKYPDSDEALAQELLFLEFSRSDTEGDVLSSSVDFLYQNSRIHLYTSNLPSDKIKQLIEQVIASIDNSSFAIIISGINAYFQQLSQYVWSTQLNSMLLTGGVILLSFMLLFGISLGLVGAITSFVPIWLVLGGQVALQIPFDFATVLVASVALGLCIDDTSHFLHRFRHYLKQGTGYQQALQQTMVDLQQPILITSLVLLLGFCVLSLSQLVVIQKFSWLVLSAILLSLMMVFILLPSVLSLKKKN